jgi:hypothetical protein
LFIFCKIFTFLEIVPLQNINLVSVNNLSQHCLFFQLVTSNTFSSIVWTYYSNCNSVLYFIHKRWCWNSACECIFPSVKIKLYFFFSFALTDTEWTNDRYRKGTCHKRRRKKGTKGMQGKEERIQGMGGGWIISHMLKCHKQMMQFYRYQILVQTIFNLQYTKFLHFHTINKWSQNWGRFEITTG